VTEFVGTCFSIRCLTLTGRCRKI